jgi:hypothetical protein
MIHGKFFSGDRTRSLKILSLSGDQSLKKASCVPKREGYNSTELIGGWVSGLRFRVSGVRRRVSGLRCGIAVSFHAGGFRVFRGSAPPLVYKAGGVSQKKAINIQHRTLNNEFCPFYETMALNFMWFYVRIKNRIPNTEYRIFRRGS